VQHLAFARVRLATRERAGIKFIAQIVESVVHAGGSLRCTCAIIAKPTRLRHNHGNLPTESAMPPFLQTDLFAKRSR
jgi:hypothetical protein